MVSAAIIVVIPKFKDIFESFGTDLPPVTQVLLDVVGLRRGKYWYLLFGIPLLLMIFCTRS